MSVPSIRETRPQAAGSIEAALFEVDAAMRRACVAQTPGHDPLAAALEHHLAAGGRRTRTRLSLTASRALGLPESDRLALAAAVELLHNASLIQDDLQDGDATRRGRPSVWRLFGKDTAIGLTDLLISAAYASLSGVSRIDALPALLRQLHAAIGVTLRGQDGDLGHCRAPGPSLEAVLATARQKSGPLFALSLELPLIRADLGDAVPQANEAACQFGVGYQIADDMEDAYGDRAAGNPANVVLALAEDLPFSDALREARRLASGHLEASRRLAQRLPRGCGALLGLLATMLEQRLKESGDG